MKKRISILLMATMLMGTFTQFVYAEDNTKNVATESYASATENTESTSNSYITHNATLEVGKAVSPSNPVCLKIYPNDAIEADSTISISIEGAKFDLDKWSSLRGSKFYYYGEDKEFSATQWDYETAYNVYSQKKASGMSEYDAILAGFEKVGVMGINNYLPWYITFKDESTAEVKLYPLVADFANTTSNSDLAVDSKVCYKIPLPITATDSEITVKLDGKNTTIKSETFKIGENAVTGQSENVISKVVSVENGKAISPDSPVKLNIYPKDDVYFDLKEGETAPSITVKVDNGKFDIDEWNKQCEELGIDKNKFYYGENKENSTNNDIFDKAFEKYGRYIEGGLTEYFAVYYLFKYIGVGNDNNYIPYSLEFVDDTTMKVTLLPICEPYTYNKGDSELQFAENACYSIPLPVVAYGSGDVSIKLDTADTTIMQGEYKIASISSTGNNSVKPGEINIDVDGDGSLTGNDAALVLAKSLDGAYVFPTTKEVTTDVDGDGSLTSNDAALILKKSQDKSFVLPIEK